jgi:hypothetical protein
MSQQLPLPLSDHPLAETLNQRYALFKETIQEAALHRLLTPFQKKSAYTQQLLNSIGLMLQNSPLVGHFSLGQLSGDLFRTSLSTQINFSKSLMDKSTSIYQGTLDFTCQNPPQASQTGRSFFILNQTHHTHAIFFPENETPLSRLDVYYNKLLSWVNPRALMPLSNKTLATHQFFSVLLAYAPRSVVEKDLTETLKDHVLRKKLPKHHPKIGFFLPYSIQMNSHHISRLYLSTKEISKLNEQKQENLLAEIYQQNQQKAHPWIFFLKD